MQFYVHGGVSTTTGHGCLSDLWTFSIDSLAWNRIDPSSDKPRLLSRLAQTKATLNAARSHCCTVLEGGTVLLYGGVDSTGAAVTQLQAVVPLIGGLSGGLPMDVSPDLCLRRAGVIAALMIVR